MMNSKPNGGGSGSIESPDSGDMNVIRNGHPPKLALGQRDAAKAISVSERTLWQLTKDGHIPSVKIGSRTVYRIEALSKFLCDQER